MTARDFLDSLRAAAPSERPGMIFDEAVDQGGTYDPTPGAVEINLHGARVRATRLDDAIAAWISDAMRANATERKG